MRRRTLVGPLPHMPLETVALALCLPQPCQLVVPAGRATPNDLRRVYVLLYGTSIAYYSSSGMHRLGLLLSLRIPASRSFASTSQSRSLTGLQGDQCLIAMKSSKHSPHRLSYLRLCS